MSSSGLIDPVFASLVELFSFAAGNLALKWILRLAVDSVNREDRILGCLL